MQAREKRMQAKTQWWRRDGRADMKSRQIGSTGKLKNTKNGGHGGTVLKCSNKG